MFVSAYHFSSVFLFFFHKYLSRFTFCVFFKFSFLFFFIILLCLFVICSLFLSVVFLILLCFTHIRAFRIDYLFLFCLCNFGAGFYFPSVFSGFFFELASMFFILHTDSIVHTHTFLLNCVFVVLLNK